MLKNKTSCRNIVKTSFDDIMTEILFKLCQVKLLVVYSWYPYIFSFHSVYYQPKFVNCHWKSGFVIFNHYKYVYYCLSFFFFHFKWRVVKFYVILYLLYVNFLKNEYYFISLLYFSSCSTPAAFHYFQVHKFIIDLHLVGNYF